MLLAAPAGSAEHVVCVPCVKGYDCALLLSNAATMSKRRKEAYEGRFLEKVRKGVL